MTLAGWVFMLSSVGFVLWLTAYCFWKVLSKPTKPTEHGIPPV
jgi:hypothetical protein